MNVQNTRKYMMKVYLKALVPLVVFAVAQGLGGVALLFCGENGYGQTATTLSLAVMISGVVAVAILYQLGMVRYIAVDTKTISRREVVGCIVAAFSCIIATDLASELLDLPDFMEEQFLGMARNVWGIVAIALVGPVVEELVFREAMLGYMLRNGVGMWAAVLMSALMFGVVHGNPVQIPFAFIMGIVFGLIYCKTGNVWLTTVIHIINNSIAVVEMNILGERAADMHYYDYIGLHGELIAIVVFALVCLYFIKKTLLGRTTDSEVLAKES